MCISMSLCILMLGKVFVRLLSQLELNVIPSRLLNFFVFWSCHASQEEIRC